MASAYLTPSQFVARYDSRRVCQLISDSGTPASVSDLTTNGTAANLVLMQLILEASSLIDAACSVGKRYSRSDLEALIDTETATLASGSATQDEKNASIKKVALLHRLCADLTWGNLIARRGFAAEAIREQAPMYEGALNMLEQLYQGARVFDLDVNQQAGVPDNTIIAKNRINSSSFNKMFGVWPGDNDGGLYLFGHYRGR